MYKLVYKTTAGSLGDTRTNEYIVWRQTTPTEAEKAFLIEYMAGQNAEGTYLPGDYVDKYTTDYNQTVAIQSDAILPEVVYTQKDAKETIIYSDGTHKIYTGTSYDYNDKYFEFDVPVDTVKTIMFDE